MYSKINENDIQALRTIVGSDNVLVGDAINPDYAHDELGGIERQGDDLCRCGAAGKQSVCKCLQYA